jgi:hypothetical protein
MDAQQAAPPAASPADRDERWTVGVCALKADGLDDEDAYLTRSLPQLLRERLESIPTHTFSAEEKAGYRREILRQERQRLSGLLDQARQRRDELLFQDLRETERERRLEEAQEAIRRIEESLAGLQQMAPQEIELPEEKPVEFLQGEGEGGLLEPSSFSALRLARQKGVELLICGTIQPLDRYLELEIRAVNVYLEKEVYTYRDIIQREEIYSVVQGVTDGLAAVVLGRPWSSLAIPGLPAGCEVWLDGKFLGAGVSRIPYLAPGSHTLRLRCPDNREQTAQLVLEPGVEQSLTPDPQPIEVGTVRIDSIPSGAQLYAGSRFLGTTPLEMEQPEVTTRLLLRLAGYGDTAWYLGPAVPPELTLKLDPLILDPAQIQTDRRRQFYRAFGWWALSFPLPFFFYGLAIDYAAGAELANDSGDVGEANRLVETGGRLYRGYQISLGLSAALFVNMAIRLGRYIRAADRKAD